MNLLQDSWIPVRNDETGHSTHISLQTLLCTQTQPWVLHLPRDDMEMAAIELLIAIAQVLWTPKDIREWVRRIATPLSEAEYQQGISPYSDWFSLDHPQWPFMQVRKVKAAEPTDMAKLFPGLTGATNSCFVNQPGVAAAACGGCSAIALFNQASNAPGFGGGFKAGLRGSAPVTTLVQGPDLRQTVWLNVLTRESLDTLAIEWGSAMEEPTWVVPIKEDSVIPGARIGLLRGLLWQPAHIELLPAAEGGRCHCCGQVVDKLYRGFNKAKFNYKVEGLWPHPFSPRIQQKKGGTVEDKFVAFTTPTPTWTQLSRYVVQQKLGSEKNSDNAKDIGQEPAEVIKQIRRHWVDMGESDWSRKFLLLAGGYRNNQASILDRRHTVFELNKGWVEYGKTIQELIQLAMNYKTILRSTLYTVAMGIDKAKRERRGRTETIKLKGTGVALHEIGEQQFYLRTEDKIMQMVAVTDFANPAPFYAELHGYLTKVCRTLFDEVTAPYRHDPVLVRTLAIARASLYKKIGGHKQSNPQEQGSKT